VYKDSGLKGSEEDIVFYKERIEPPPSLVLTPPSHVSGSEWPPNEKESTGSYSGHGPPVGYLGTCVPVLPVTLWPNEGELTGLSPGHALPVNNHVLAVTCKTGLLKSPALPIATMDIVAAVTGSTAHSLPVALPAPQLSIMVQAVLWVINTLHNPSTNSGVYPVPNKLLPMEIGELSTLAVVNYDIYVCCSTSYCHALLPYVLHDWPYSFIYCSCLYGSRALVCPMVATLVVATR